MNYFLIEYTLVIKNKNKKDYVCLLERAGSDFARMAEAVVDVIAVPEAQDNG